MKSSPGRWHKPCSQLLLRFLDGVLRLQTQTRPLLGLLLPPILILVFGWGLTYDNGRELLQRCIVCLRAVADFADGLHKTTGGVALLSEQRRRTVKQAKGPPRCSVSAGHLLLAKWRFCYRRPYKQPSSSPVRYHLYGRAKQQPACLLSLDASLVPRCYAVKF